ncbi:PR domain zinc finger protein 1 [Gracilariopsis chorda]|uniref:PR domain zinc finger protein 1 n=1 Tax=Gracilariopsis chorda TaxID=448386 RepID=A0A2V3J2E6_9FLOR|nr:PR domain zinc finger protein 1 [Gracilariopsis chorda]|eukprot:PXF48513.1 PR domain zinc finger protein 1 [Gracilariopsis chorda]
MGMTSRAVVSGLHTLVQAVEAAEAAAADAAAAAASAAATAAAAAAAAGAASPTAASPTAASPTAARTNGSRRRARQVAGGFECPHPGCARVFSKRYNQQAHMRLHDGTRPFDCELCGKAFMWKSSLKSHAKMHAKMVAEGRTCSRRLSAVSKKKRVKKGWKKDSTCKGVNAVALDLDKVREECDVVQADSGRLSPNNVAMMDHDAATVLTTFR